MANNIRTPRQGVTANSRAIADAVDDQAWQEFRVSMKGKSTREKLAMLKSYWEKNDGDANGRATTIVIRVDNYIKALCRGGQLKPGESLQTALAADWKLTVLK